MLGMFQELVHELDAGVSKLWMLEGPQMPKTAQNTEMHQNDTMPTTRLYGFLSRPPAQVV